MQSMETLLVKMVKEYEPWRKSFILQLYENTKDAVEVARRNYLESRLANGLKREMREIREKYGSFCTKQNERQLFIENFAACQALEDATDAAILQLKNRSDEFVAISTGGWPFKVEYLTYDEILRVELPNYSRFLYDPNIMSFGPISEKWEKVKASFSQEFMNLVELHPTLSMGRSYLSAASSMALSNSESIEDFNHERKIEGASEVQENSAQEATSAEPEETSSTNSLQASSSLALSISEASEDLIITDEPKVEDVSDLDDNSLKQATIDEPEETPVLTPANTNIEPEPGEIPDFQPNTAEFSGDSQDVPSDKLSDGISSNPTLRVKPQVKKRTLQKTLTGAWSQILSSAAQSAGNKRATNRTSRMQWKNAEERDRPSPETTTVVGNPSNA